ncbi:MAG: hypothetical protein H0W08_09205 [Acidobacteria bacterium]|nr:hypothetical protein [Acidobacteriota bacterium]
MSADTGRSTARVGRLAAQPVRIDTSRYAGQSGRIVMRLRAEGAPAGVRIRWTARGPLANGMAQPGERVVVLERVAFASAIENVLSFEIHATGGVPGETIVLIPEFIFETSADEPARPAFFERPAPTALRSGSRWPRGRCGLTRHPLRSGRSGTRRLNPCLPVCSPPAAA